MLVSDLCIVTTFKAVIVAFLVYRVFLLHLVFALFANILGCVNLRG